MSLAAGRHLNATWVLDPQIAALIRHKANTLSKLAGFPYCDPEDIEQDLTVHLLTKAVQFDPSRAQAKTFAARCIKNHAKSIRRAALRQKRDWRRKVSMDAECDGTTISLAQTIEESDGRRHTGHCSRSETELTQLKLDIAEANQNLPLPLRNMAALLSHVPPFAAAQVMGISRRQAALHVATLRECYEARGLGK